jgi:hypothetical protein
MFGAGHSQAGVNTLRRRIRPMLGSTDSGVAPGIYAY